jgi:CheY-like chemotaxis protein
MHLLERFPELRRLVAVVLEDNEVIRSIVRDTLQELGIGNLRYAATEGECIDLLSGGERAILLVECREDWPDGLRVVEKLKNQGGQDSNPPKIISLLPFPTRHQVLAVRQAGADAVVAEPFSTGVLAKHVVGVLGIEHHFSD